MESSKIQMKTQPPHIDDVVNFYYKHSLDVCAIDTLARWMYEQADSDPEMEMGRKAGSLNGKFRLYRGAINRYLQEIDFPEDLYDYVFFERNIGKQQMKLNMSEQHALVMLDLYNKTCQTDCFIDPRISKKHHFVPDHFQPDYDRVSELIKQLENIREEDKERLLNIQEVDQEGFEADQSSVS